MNELTGTPKGVVRKSLSGPQCLRYYLERGPAATFKEATTTRAPHVASLGIGALSKNHRAALPLFLLSLFHRVLHPSRAQFPFYFGERDPNISVDTAYFVPFIVPGSGHRYLSAGQRYHIRPAKLYSSKLSF